MMLRLSIAMAVAAAYVGIIDVNALRGATAVKVATYSAICLGFAVLVFALAVFGLASSYKTMIADNFFDIGTVHGHIALKLLCTFLIFLRIERCQSPLPKIRP